MRVDYLDASGTLHRTQAFEADPLGRTTWDSWGQEPSGEPRFRVTTTALFELDGRPVAFIKSRFAATWQRQTNLQRDCSRNGESAPCGVYFSEELRTPSGQLARTYDSNGPAASAWVKVPGDGIVHARFLSNDDTTHWFGAALEGFEYRRFQKCASPVFTPLRFPGQYHDVETDLFENWNRFYDPSIGRYLAPEPLLYSPAKS